MAQTPKIIQCLLQRRIVCRFLRELLSYQKEKKVEAERKKKTQQKTEYEKGEKRGKDRAREPERANNASGWGGRGSVKVRQKPFGLEQ